MRGGVSGFFFFFLTKTGQRTFCVRTRERGLGNREGGRAAGTGKSFVQVPEPNTWIQMEKRAGGALYVGVSRTKWQELVLLWLHGDLEKCIIVSIHKKSSGISLIFVISWAVKEELVTFRSYIVFLPSCATATHFGQIFRNKKMFPFKWSLAHSVWHCIFSVIAIWFLWKGDKDIDLITLNLRWVACDPVNPKRLIMCKTFDETSAVEFRVFLAIAE